MGVDERYILVGIVIGGILLSIAQIFLLKFVEEYRRYAFVLPIVLCFVVISFSLLDSGTVFSGETMENRTIEYYSIDADSNYQPVVFQLDWKETLIYWLPRLSFSLLPLIPTVIFAIKKKAGKKRMK